MKTMMAILYIVHGVKNVRNLRICLKLIGHFARDTARENPGDVMLGSLRLKLRILR